MDTNIIDYTQYLQYISLLLIFLLLSIWFNGGNKW